MFDECRIYRMGLVCSFECLQCRGKCGSREVSIRLISILKNMHSSCIQQTYTRNCYLSSFSRIIAFAECSFFVLVMLRVLDRRTGHCKLDFFSTLVAL